MSRPRLSVVVITLNEAERLRACLESAAWADELVVVDAESQDKTVQIAREFTDRVLVRPWAGFAEQKNFAVAQATGDWILSLDADEEVPPELRAEIQALLGAEPAEDGYRVPRRNIFWGRWIRHGGLYPDWQLRLFRRGRGVWNRDRRGRRNRGNRGRGGRRFLAGGRQENLQFFALDFKGQRFHGPVLLQLLSRPLQFFVRFEQEPNNRDILRNIFRLDKRHFYGIFSSQFNNVFITGAHHETRKKFRLFR